MLGVPLGSWVKIQTGVSDPGQALESKLRRSREVRMEGWFVRPGPRPPRALCRAARATGGWVQAGRCHGARRQGQGVVGARFRTDPWLWAQQLVARGPCVAPRGLQPSG